MISSDAYKTGIFALQKACGEVATAIIEAQVVFKKLLKTGLQPDDTDEATLEYLDDTTSELCLSLEMFRDNYIDKFMEQEEELELPEEVDDPDPTEIRDLVRHGPRYDGD